MAMARSSGLARCLCDGGRDATPVELYTQESAQQAPDQSATGGDALERVCYDRDRRRISCARGEVAAESGPRASRSNEAVCVCGATIMWGVRSPVTMELSAVHAVADSRVLPVGTFELLGWWRWAAGDGPATESGPNEWNTAQSSVLHSQPKSTVGTPAYIAPEVLLKKEYDGKVADVWSCGVTLYVMLVGAYPFEDPDEPKNFRKTIQRILGVQYSVPDYVHISPECQDLISRVFVANPSTRITMPEIRRHPWFLKNLPADLVVDDGATSKQYEEPEQPMQSTDEIMQILGEATIPAAGSRGLNQFLGDGLDLDDDMEDLDSDADLDLDLESSGEIVYAM